MADVVSFAHGIRFHDSALMTLAQAIAAGLFSGSSDLGQSIGYPFMVNFVGADYAFRDLVTAVATNTSGATVFHCSAGKDRTGWGARPSCSPCSASPGRRSRRTSWPATSTPATRRPWS